jgi:tetratricopeptide (TPR) repeat protein
MRLAASDFLEKPITPEELRQTVASVLEESRPHAEEEPPPTYDEVLTAVREALRAGKLNTAESLLMKAGSITAEDAAFLNLAGVFHEAMGRKDAAKRFYGKAIRAKHDYVPAQQNMRRMYELATFGWTQQPVALGDEPDVLAKIDECGVGLTARLKKLLKQKE